jgi:hypothetical protein
MANMVHADTSELDGLIEDFEALPKNFMPKVEKVVSKGSLNIKGDWAKRWQGHPSIAHLPRAINYDTRFEGPHTVEGEIGPAHEKTQGVLGHVIEFGKAEYGNMRNAPIPGGQPALDAEEEKFVRALADLGEDGLGGGRGR